jgi:ribosome-binding factor A
MSLHRIERVNELIQREVAGAFYRVLNPAEFDHVAATVTHVITAQDLRTAKVLVSIYGDEEKRKRMLSTLLHNRAALQREMSKHLSMKWTPRIHFELDESLEKGDRVLKILNDLHLPPAEPGDEKKV